VCSCVCVCVCVCAQVEVLNTAEDEEWEFLEEGTPDSPLERGVCVCAFV